jgi:hypothetical protein
MTRTTILLRFGFVLSKKPMASRASSPGTRIQNQNIARSPTVNPYAK